MALQQHFYTWRDRVLASPGFHRWSASSILTRWIARRRARELFDITAGFVYSQVLMACVRLDLFEQLADGPRSTEQLARVFELPAEGLLRLLEAATELRLVRRAGRDAWGLGELGAASRGSPGINAMVRHHDLLYRDLMDPLALLRDRSGSGLRDYWTYAAAPGHSESGAAARYSELMALSQSFVADDVLAHTPLHGRRRLLDVGGGSGQFAARALEQFPALKATVFDLPSVADLARDRFAREGLAERAAAIDGNVFADPLPADHDVVSLVRILHDHDDAAVRQILAAVRLALRPDGLLIVAEPMADTASAPGVGAYFQFYLWAMGSGRPRTAERLRELLEEAGFADVRERRTNQPLQIRLLTARPAGRIGL